MHLMRKELGLTFGDMRKISIPRALSIFDTYAATVDPKRSKFQKTRRKNYTVDDMEKDW